MACEKNSGLISKLGATAAGVPATASKNGYITGAMFAKIRETMEAIQQTWQSPVKVVTDIDQKIDRVGKGVSPVVNAVIGFTGDAQKREGARMVTNAAASTVKATRAGLAVAATAGPLAGVEQATNVLTKTTRQAENKNTLLIPTRRPQLPLTPKMMIQRAARKSLTEMITTRLGTDLAEATKTRAIGAITQTRRRLVIFKKDEVVPLWQSKMTGPLNRLDVIGTVQSRNIVSSSGVMLKTKNVTWHRGTTVVKMPDGKRTVTHLQSLKSPSTHHFFDRPLSDEHAAAVAGGIIKPETVPGFVGSISRNESLIPVWAQVKRAMILTRLHWPPPARRQSEGERGSH